MFRRDVFYSEADTKLWDVIYINRHGNKQCVRYCATSKENAERLFKFEQQRGEVLIEIKKAKVDKV